jgi:hypothetical protein
MNEKNEVYKEIAIEQRMYFDCFRSPEIFITMRSNDFSRLNRLQEICGGRVADGAYSHRSSAHSDIWGRYVWHMEGEEAYQFCLAILPYLRIYDPWRYGFCRQCINVHESRRYESTGT